MAKGGQGVMKIIELLGEISKQGETIASVAKRINGISEKPLRKALQEAGYIFSNQVPKGWHYQGEGPEPLDKSIFDYTPKATAKKKTTSQKSTKETKPNPIYTKSNPTIQTESNQISKPMNLEETMEYLDKLKMKKVTYEIEEHLHDELKIMAIRQKRNVSEIVNELIKKGLG